MEPLDLPPRTIVPGPPGTGKTRRCLAEVENELLAGTPPERIAYVSFTRAAVQEARDRARDQFSLDRERMPYFRTLHSLALYLMGASARELMSKDQLRELGGLLREDLTGFDSLDEAGEPRVRRPGATALFLDQLSRTTGKPLAEVYKRLPPHDRPPWRLVERAAGTYTRFRDDTGALDFTDLLELGAKHADAPNLELAVVDEAQDLTPLQWRFAQRVLSRCGRLLIAGDDDQAVYLWNGAAPEVFIHMEGTVDPLTQSYRLPRAIHQLAEGVASRIQDRRPKTFAPRAEEGEVRHHRGLTSVPIESTPGSWLLLARHGKDVNAIARELSQRGILYRTRRGWSVDESHRRALKALRMWRSDGVAPGEDAREAIRLFVPKGQVPPELPEMVEAGEAIAEELAPERIRYEPSEVLLFDHVHGEPRAYLHRLLNRGQDPAAEPQVVVSTIHGAKGSEADHVALLGKLNRRTSHAWAEHPDDERRVLYVAVTRARKELHLISAGHRNEYPLTRL